MKDTNNITVIGTREATDIGNYTFTFYLNNPRAEWTNGTSTPIQVNWSINRAPITVIPSQASSLTYDGSSQSPTWSNYDSGELTIDGTLSGINAGSYTAVFTPKANYRWSDEDGVNAKNVSWVIGKAANTITLSKNSVSLDTSTLTDTFTVTRSGDGVISVTSSDSTIATATLSGNTVTVEAVTNGNATVTVSVAEGTNYLAATDATASVSVSLVPALNDATWAQISEIAQAGTGANYWDIGDVKMITLNGKIGDYLTLSNQSLGVFILGFNHADNGASDSNIIFGGFKSALTSGVDVALVDSRYYKDTWSSYHDGGKCFNMNHQGQTSSSSSAGYYNTNYGGWKGCDLRYDILGATSTAPSQYNQHKTSSNVGYDATAATLTNPKSNTFLAALPSDLRSVIRLRTHYVDNKGNKSNLDANVTSVTDAVSLLAEYETFGLQTKANQYEQNYQTQFMYYIAGNGKIKYKHSNNPTAVQWWNCSPINVSAAYFCLVSDNGGVGSSEAAYSQALAPAFKV